MAAARAQHGGSLGTLGRAAAGWALAWGLGVALVAGGCSDDADPSPTDDTVGDVSADAADADVGAEPAEDPRCCPAGVCPIGEFCLDGACHPSAGASGCYLDGECAEGQSCEGAVACACGDGDSCDPRSGQCLWPEGCCNADAECPSGEVCHEGMCRVPPSELGRCWTDAQCSTGEACESGGSCACGSSGCEAEPGYCSLPGVCCLNDTECGDEGRCVGNRCVPELEGNECFSSADCNGEAVCAGAYVCPCGDTSCLVLTTPGVCTSAETCCTTQADCASGTVCVDGKKCLAAPGGNQCWVDEHCGPGRVCEGASVCDCGEPCVGGFQQGECRTVPELCTGDADCDAGMRCVIPDTAHCPGQPAPTTGVCVEQIDSGCWSKDDCAPYQRCSPDLICTSPGGCPSPNVPGTCDDYVIDGNCCTSHRECRPGSTCRNSNTSVTCPPAGTAVCLPDPAFGETCWSAADCPEGLVCNGPFICACNARCATSRDGVCDPPEGQFCKTDVDCGTGWQCAKDQECVVSPCVSDGNDCPVTGRCEPKQPNKCWNHAQCGSGNYCKGLRICPSNTNCNDPDKPGSCAEREGLGECCDSYHACGPGLQCTSAANQDVCVLDVTSVCVPIVPSTQQGTICYTDRDCLTGQVCQGATYCPCGLSACEGEPTAGACVAAGAGG